MKKACVVLQKISIYLNLLRRLYSQKAEARGCLLDTADGQGNADAAIPWGQVIAILLKADRLEDAPVGANGEIVIYAVPCGDAEVQLSRTRNVGGPKHTELVPLPPPDLNFPVLHTCAKGILAVTVCSDSCHLARLQTGGLDHRGGSVISPRDPVSHDTADRVFFHRSVWRQFEGPVDDAIGRDIILQ